MRARYYEFPNGRFISQDPSQNGLNWFVYANQDPINQLDSTGKDSESESDLGKQLTDWAKVLGLVKAWEEYVKESKTGHVDLFRVGAKGVNGAQRTIVSAWALAAIAGVIRTTIQAIRSVDSFAAGIGAAAHAAAAMYACVVILFIDAIDVAATSNCDALIDQWFPMPK